MKSEFLRYKDLMVKDAEESIRYRKSRNKQDYEKIFNRPFEVYDARKEREDRELYAETIKENLYDAKKLYDKVKLKIMDICNKLHIKPKIIISLGIPERALFEKVTGVSVAINHPQLFFSYFLDDDNNFEIDDIIEDKEDLDGIPEEQVNEYFSIVQALQNPKFFDELEKSISVYTARPTKDRKFYSGKTVPSGIYVTTSFSEAEGYSMEFQDRDIYKIIIKKKYLLQTLNIPNRKNYTVVGNGFVPVEKILML